MLTDPDDPTSEVLTRVELDSLVGVADSDIAPPGTAYDLDGDGTFDTIGSHVVHAIILGVSASDAKDLNDRIDGPDLGADLGVADSEGRVKFLEPGAAGADVYIYLTHR